MAFLNITLLSLLYSKLERTSPSLTPQLDTVIIEVSSVKGLSLRGNTLRLYRAKHLPLMNWCTLAKLGILTWKYSHLLKMRIWNFFKPLLTWVMTKITPFGDLANISHHLKLLSLAQRLRYVHHSQARPISYTLQVADYWSSTATLSYKQLDSLVKSKFSYCMLCYTAAHPRIHSAFYGNSVSSED